MVVLISFGFVLTMTRWSDKDPISGLLLCTLCFGSLASTCTFGSNVYISHGFYYAICLIYFFWQFLCNEEVTFFMHTADGSTLLPPLTD